MGISTGLLYQLGIATLVTGAFAAAGGTYSFPLIGFLLVLFSPAKFRRPMLAIASLTLAFFSPHIFVYSGVLTNTTSEVAPFTALGPASGLLPLIAVALFFLLARAVALRDPRTAETVRATLPILACAMFALPPLLSAWPTLYALSLLTALSLATCVWIIVLSLDRQVAVHFYRDKKSFWLYTPFFQRDPIPYFHVDALTNLRELREEDIPYREIFCKSAELLLLAAGLRLCAYVLYGRLEWPSPWIGTEAFIAFSPNVFSAWVSVVFSALHFLILIYVRGSIAALTLALFGIVPVYSMQRPWKSKSFHEFIGRSMYFYNYILTTAFWPTLVRVLRPVPLGRKGKIFVLVFLSAAYFSFCYHLLRAHQILLHDGFATGLRTYSLTIAPYVIGFSLMLALSAVAGKFWRLGDRYSSVRVLKIVCFVMAYAAIFALVINYEIESLDTRATMMRYLFTGQK